MESSELLKQLRIERKDDLDTPPGRRWLLIAGVILTLAALAAGWFLARSGPISVVVTTALPLRDGTGQASILDATGYVVARRQATVSAKITGKVNEVLIEEGQRVREGQVLARLDPVDADAQLALAKMQQEAAQSQVADLKVQLEQAERELARQRQLARRDFVSDQAVEQARLTADSLRARLAVQQRQIAVANRSLQVAQVNLDNTVVRAPFSGVIVAKTAQPGEIVSPMSAGGGFTRTGIGTIVDMDSLEIEVDVNESFIGRVRPGQPVDARLNAYPDWKIPAEVIAIIPTADRSKATVKVRVALQAKDPRIVPEMGVRVSFLNEAVGQVGVSVKPSGVTIPVAALRVEGEQAVVFVYREGMAERRAVRLGEAAGDDRRVLAGIKAGERVILNPPQGLRDRETVKLEKEYGR